MRRQADSEMAPQGIDIAQSGLGNGAQIRASAAGFATLHRLAADAATGWLSR